MPDCGIRSHATPTSHSHQNYLLRLLETFVIDLIFFFRHRLPHHPSPNFLLHLASSTSFFIRPLLLTIQTNISISTWNMTLDIPSASFKSELTARTPAAAKIESKLVTRSLNQIDKVQAHCVGDHIDLSQLVVCGYQSAGKSSILEGIAGIAFSARTSCVQNSLRSLSCAIRSTT